MEIVEFSWICEDVSLKEALKKTLRCSGQQLKKNYTSTELQRVVTLRDVIQIPLELVNHLSINPCYVGPEVKVLFENEDVLVLHKPPRVHCHPHSYMDMDTILNFLVVNNKWQVLNVNSKNYDRGLLYRLDYETSGVLVMAKSDKYFLSVREKFLSTVKNKFYWAIVEGDFDKEGDWTHYLRSFGQKGLKQKVSEIEIENSVKGKLSIIKLLSSKHKSLLLIKLQTGHRHQIRAQLSFLGYPILGDELYGGARAQRLFLHAFRYEFNEFYEDPNPELFSFFFNLNCALEMSHDMLRRF